MGLASPSREIGQRQQKDRRTMTTGTLALIILIAILAQAGVAALIALRRRRRQYRELDAGSGESNVHSAAQTPIPPTSPTEAWTGFREFAVQRRVFEDESRSICSFYLVPCDGKPLPAFRPGQFLTVRLARQLAERLSSVPEVAGDLEVVSQLYLQRPDYDRVDLELEPLPLIPADAVFHHACEGRFDAVIALYHDQGHIPMKFLGFQYNDKTGQWGEMSGVNITLGLPIIRTSVDHGTAFGKAGEGRANPQSMIEAIQLGAMLAKRS